MNDPEIAAALRAKEPNALAALFDTYADRLFRYCWFLLRSRDIAQIALRDTLIVAAAHIDLLADPESLSSWVYALARAECRRRRPVPPAEADEPPARPTQPDADTRLMAWNTVTSMDPAEAEVLELACRHDVDLGLVLGMPDVDARGLLDRARNHLERALGAEIVVSRAGHACPDRAEVLRGWSGAMTGGLRARVLRHAATCPVCGPNMPRNVSAARVFGMLPVISPPPAMRAQVLAFAADPQTAAYREFAIDRALLPRRPVRVPQRPADPVPAPASAARRHRGRLTTVGAAGVVAVAFAVISSAIVIGLPGGAHGPGQRAASTQAQPGGPGLRRQDAGAIGALPAGRAQPTSAPSPLPVPLPTASTGVTVFTTLTKPLQGPSPHGPASLPPRVPGGRVTGPPAPPHPPGHAQGMLTATPGELDVGSASYGEIVLTAKGGPDTWSAGTSSGEISLSGYGGFLGTGQSVTIVVTVNRSGDGGGNASIYLDQGTPAAQTIRVSWSGSWPGKPPRPTPSPTPTPTTPSPTPTPTTPSPSPSGSSGSSPPASPSYALSTSPSASASPSTPVASSSPATPRP
jgi:DNA-directed RNA polymerase specialized sigma24 family protein